MMQHAVILAGGHGTRLRPYTTLLPKALMPVGDAPILALLLQQLKQAGFTRVTLAVGHLAGLIQAYFGDGRQWGLNIEYAIEHKPLGTAGPLRLLGAGLPEHFLVLNADVLCNLPFDAVIKQHCASGAVATVASYHRPTPVAFGVLTLNQQNRLTQFVEKPVLHHWVSMGVYAFSRAVLPYIPEDTHFGFDDLMHALLKANAPVQAYPFTGYWRDIGCVSDYEQAVQDLIENPNLLGCGITQANNCYAG